MHKRVPPVAMEHCTSTMITTTIPRLLLRISGDVFRSQNLWLTMFGMKIMLHIFLLKKITVIGGQ